jgi:hypothetical protein
MKIFGIGLSRTGTSSLSLALARLGLHCIHFPRTMEMIAAVPAAADTPVALAYKWLDALYPHSKFILTVREKESWLSSCEALWSGHLQRQDRFTATVHRGLYGCERFDRELFAATYDRHIADVNSHFSQRAEDLLTMNICAGEGWEKLCPFLGFEMPPDPFPKSNTRAALGTDWIRDCPPWGARVARLAPATPSGGESTLARRPTAGVSHRAHSEAKGR